ncbi:MAG: NAD(+) diphosphatase [Gallionella sp.]
MDEAGYWVLRYENKLLVTTNRPDTTCFPHVRQSTLEICGNALLVGSRHDSPCYAADLDKFPESLQLELIPLRSLLGVAGPEDGYLAGRAVQLLDWQKNHKFCGTCGALTDNKGGQFAKVCQVCGLVSYPRISPAVMVLIRRDDEVLLARGHRYRPGIYSALAGFVEAGETLLQCAIREVHEEVGMEIANLRYFGSQSWPFPDSLMVAFFADYVGGELNPDPVEIQDAKWFPCDALPPLPEPVSIAFRLISAGSR